MNTEEIALPSTSEATEPVRKDTEKTHLGVLDALRGALALWVLGGHAAACSGFSFPLLDRPGLAVDIFMFISGLLMAYHFRLRESVEPWNSPGTWWKFYVRRFFRIAPAYYLLLTTAFVFRTQLYGAFSDIVSTYRPPGFPLPIVTPPLTWADALSHFTFIFALIPKYVTNTCLADWSIGLEMQFYLVFPFIMLSYRRLSYFWATLLFLATWVAAKALFGVYDGSAPKLLATFPQPSFLPLKLNCFIVGILVAEAMYLRALDWPKAAVLLLGAFAVTLKGTSLPFQAACLITCMFLLGLRLKTPAILDRIPFRRLVSFLADTSYGVYLSHPFFLLPIAALLLRYPAYAHLPAPARFAVAMLAVSSLCYPLSYLLFRFVETPGIAFGRRLLRGCQLKQAPKLSREGFQNGVSLPAEH